MKIRSLASIVAVMSCFSFVMNSLAVDSQVTTNPASDEINKMAEILQRLERAELYIALLQTSQGLEPVNLATDQTLSLAEDESGLMTIVRLANRNNHAAKELLERYLAKSADNKTKLAWLYATSIDPTVRDANRALELSGSFATSTSPSPWMLSLRGAIYAAKGEFSQAIELQMGALELLQKWTNEYSTISFPQYPRFTRPQSVPPQNPSGIANLYAKQMQRNLDAYRENHVCILTNSPEQTSLSWWSFNTCVRPPEELRRSIEEYQRKIAVNEPPLQKQSPPPINRGPWQSLLDGTAKDWKPNVLVTFTTGASVELSSFTVCNLEGSAGIFFNGPKNSEDLLLKQSNGWRLVRLSEILIMKCKPEDSDPTWLKCEVMRTTQQDTTICGMAPIRGEFFWRKAVTLQIIGKTKLLGADGDFVLPFHNLRSLSRDIAATNQFTVVDNESHSSQVADLTLRKVREPGVMIRVEDEKFRGPPSATPVSIQVSTNNATYTLGQDRIDTINLIHDMKGTANMTDGNSVEGSIVGGGDIFGVTRGGLFVCESLQTVRSLKLLRAK